MISVFLLPARLHAPLPGSAFGVFTGSLSAPVLELAPSPLWIAIVAIAGLLFGSFLNVCIARLPHHRSILWPGSHCPHCQAGIRPYDNIPLVSFLLLRGRCRHCHTRISPRYPLVEAATAALFLLATFHFGPGSAALLAAVFSFLLLGLLVMDAECFLLPDTFTLPGIAFGVAQSLLPVSGQAGEGGNSLGSPFSNHAADPAGGLIGCLHLAATTPFPTPAWPAWQGSLLGAAGAASLLLAIRWLYWVVRRQQGMGLGDVKLAALLGAWLGVAGASLALTLAVLLAALCGLILMARPNQPGTDRPALRLPLGSFLSLGGLLTLYCGAPLLTWYFQFWR